MQNMNETYEDKQARFIERYNFEYEYYVKKKILPIHLENAKDVLERGLRYFLGNDAKWQPEYDEVAEWLEDNKCRGLLCAGDCGRGKTLLCQKIMPTIFKCYLDKELLVYDANDINDAYKDDSKKSDLIDSRKFLMIDDFGLEGEAVIYGEHKIVFNDIIDKAEKQGRLLILTTNLMPDEIEMKYGRRTIDRLKAITKPVIFKGDSLRG